MQKKITIASCQFPVDGDIKANLSFIKKQIKIANAKNAGIVHFSECSLSGYAGVDFVDYKTQDEHILAHAIDEIKNLASQLKIYIILGSHHFIKGQKKPMNSLYLINDKGIVLDRYDKRFLFGMNEEIEGGYYACGSDKVIFNYKGIICGLLICHEWRYTELYREYKKAGVQLIFQSFYDRSFNTAEYSDNGIDQRKLVTGTMIGNAANNYLWISATNTSKKESCFPSMVIQPTGKIKGKLSRNKTGVLITEIDFTEQFDDPSNYWRSLILK